MRSDLSLKATIKICKASIGTGRCVGCSGARFWGGILELSSAPEVGLITRPARCHPCAQRCRQSHRSSRPGSLRPPLALALISLFIAVNY